MPRSIRSFSMDLSAQVALDEVASNASWCALLMPPSHGKSLLTSLPPPPVMLDADGLRPEDYETLRALTPIPKTVPLTSWDALRAALITHFPKATPADGATIWNARKACKAHAAVAFRDYKRALRAYKAEEAKSERAHLVRHGAAAGSVNISRIVDALIFLGVEALKERAGRSVEKAGSKSVGRRTGYVGQTGNKLANTSSRKKAAA